MSLQLLFNITLVVTYIILLLVIWSIIAPHRRIWPPPRKNAWQYHLYWWLFYIDTALALWLVARTWNTWLIPDVLRYFLGIPLLVLGAAFSVWGIVALGIGNTYGLARGFIQHGPYRFSRNPQYVGDITMLSGLTLLANASLVAVILLLAILIFMLMPLSEEQWLPMQYDDAYQSYKTQTPRFL